MQKYPMVKHLFKEPPGLLLHAATMRRGWVLQNRGRKLKRRRRQASRQRILQFDCSTAKTARRGVTVAGASPAAAGVRHCCTAARHHASSQASSSGAQRRRPARAAGCGGGEIEIPKNLKLRGCYTK